jgi:hypothetical protein
VALAMLAARNRHGVARVAGSVLSALIGMFQVMTAGSLIGDVRRHALRDADAIRSVSWTRPTPSRSSSA